jgi:hypothetical protein
MYIKLIIQNLFKYHYQIKNDLNIFDDWINKKYLKQLLHRGHRITLFLSSDKVMDKYIRNIRAMNKPCEGLLKQK